MTCVAIYMTCVGVFFKLVSGSKNWRAGNQQGKGLTTLVLAKALSQAAATFAELFAILDYFSAALL